MRGSPDDVGAWGDGRIYVIELWGTWCAPCLPLIPKLSALQDRLCRARRGGVVGRDGRIAWKGHGKALVTALAGLLDGAP